MIDVAQMKSRFVRMVVIDLVCLVVGMAAAVVAVRTGPEWLWGVFVVALVVGFAAQIWFVAGFKRSQKGA
jgi:hypothetical protein